MLAIVLVACQSNKPTDNIVTDVNTNAIIPQISTDSNSKATDSKSSAEILMEKSDCYTCHSMDTKLIGPSFIEISEKYKNTKDDVQKLSDKIINGGSGVWGEVPMQAHSQMSKEDAAEMVKFILSIK